MGCGKCAAACPSGASQRGDHFDVHQLLDAPAGSRRGDLGAALRRIQRHAPDGPVDGAAARHELRTIDYDAERCLGCGTCARACPAEAIEARPPKAARAARRRAGGVVVTPRTRPSARAAVRVRRHHGQHRLRPRSRQRLGAAGRHTARRATGAAASGPGAACSSSWRPATAPAGLRRLLAATSPRAACRRSGARGLHLEIADIREGCSGCTATTSPP